MLDVRIVKNKAGKSKGYAYVEFKDEVSKSNLIIECNKPNSLFSHFRSRVIPPKNYYLFLPVMLEVIIDGYYR